MLWYSDLRGFTRITDQAPPQQIIPLLNDYAEAVISAVYDNDGDVLKLIGDGILAIFTAADAEEACRCAIAAQTALRGRIAALNQRRAGDNLPTTEVYLGLHIGEVFYGNIGSDERLDFTVVGPAVNEVARYGGARTGSPGLGGPLRAARCRAAAGAVHARSLRGGLTPGRSSAAIALATCPPTSCPAAFLLCIAICKGNHPPVRL